MGFSIGRTTSTNVPTYDTYSGDLTINGGTTSPPTTGGEVMDLVRRWAENQNQGNSQQMTAEVTPKYINVYAPNVNTPSVPYLMTKPVVLSKVLVARFIANKPAVVAENPVYGLIKVSNGSFVLGAGSNTPDFTGEVGKSTDGITDWAATGANLGAIGASTGYGGLVYSGTKFFAVNYTTGYQLQSSTDGATWAPKRIFAGYNSHAAIDEKVCVALGVADVEISADGGDTWSTVSTNGSGVGIRSVGRTPAGFVAFGVSGIANIYAYTSPTGAAWTFRGGVTGATYATGLGQPCTHKDGLVVVRYAGTNGATGLKDVVDVFYSTDGLAFAKATVPANLTTYAAQVGGTSNFFALASNGTNIVLLSHYQGGATVYTSTDDGAIFIERTTGAASSFTELVAHNGLFILYSHTDATRRYTSTDGITWVEVAAGEGETGVTVTPEDITNANSGGGAISFFPAAGLDPAYLTAASAAVGLNYPPSQPAAYVDGTFARAPIFYALDGQLSYLIASFNGQFFNFVTGQWQDAQTVECRQPANYSSKDGFTALLVSIADGPPLAQAFYVSGYNSAGTLLGVELVAACTTAPAFLQLASGSQYMNFTTWKLQADPTAQTWLEPTDLQAGWVTPTATWHMFIADMPITAAGLEPYVPPTSVAAPGTGDGDYIGTDTGTAPAPYGPFTLLVAGGFNEIASPPVRKQVTAGGFNAVTAPPLPVRVGGGFMESGSSIVLYASATAVTQHMGLPFTTQQG